MGVFELPDNRYFSENVSEAAPTYEDVCGLGFPMVDLSFSHEGASVPGNILPPRAIHPHEAVPQHAAAQNQQATQRLWPEAHVRPCERCRTPLQYPLQPHICDAGIIQHDNVQMAEFYHECPNCFCIISHPDQPHRCPAMGCGLPRMDGASGSSAQTTSSENHMDNACAQRLVYFDDDIANNTDSNSENVLTSEFGLPTDKGQRYECAVCACVLEFSLQEHCCPEQEWPEMYDYMFEHLQPLPGNNSFRMRM